MPRTLGKHTNHFGPFIRQRRRELSLTQREVAAALKVSAPEFVGMIESGLRKPNFERLPALAEVLQVPVLEMIQMAFADVYPSLVGYLTQEQTAQTAKANRLGQKLYALIRREEGKSGVIYLRCSQTFLFHHFAAPASPLPQKSLFLILQVLGQATHLGSGLLGYCLTDLLSELQASLDLLVRHSRDLCEEGVSHWCCFSASQQPQSRLSSG